MPKICAKRKPLIPNRLNCRKIARTLFLAQKTLWKEYSTEVSVRDFFDSMNALAEILPQWQVVNDCFSMVRQLLLSVFEYCYQVLCHHSDACIVAVLWFDIICCTRLFTETSFSFCGSLCFFLKCITRRWNLENVADTILRICASAAIDFALNGNCNSVQ